MVMESALKPVEMGPLFRLTSNLAEVMTYEEACETFSAMGELNIDTPPYNLFTVCLEPKFLAKYLSFHHGDIHEKGQISGKEFGEMWEQLNFNLFIIYEFKKSGFAPKDDAIRWIFALQKVGTNDMDFAINTADKGMNKNLDQIAASVYQFLIVLLATQNSEKTTVKNSPRAGSHRLREDSKYFEYTTTIRIGKVTQQYEGTGSSIGSKKRAHLRRGHIRRQRYGEGRSEIKKVFIPPVFVNADENWIKNERKEYKVLMA